MEKTTLKTYLQSNFSFTSWVQILKFIDDNRSLLTIHLEPKIRTNELTDQRSQSLFRTIKEVGTLKTTDGAELPIFDVELENSVNIERNKVGVNSLLKRIMTNNAYRGILVTYHYHKNESLQSEWRFSFISKSGASDYFAEVEAQETNPKKYTYIFGTPEEHRTAIDRLYTLKQSRLRIENFFDAFNVEPLSRGFFNEYKNFYEDFTAIVIEQYLHIFKQNRPLKADATSKEKKEYDENVQRDARNFVKRLLSRIIFLYFLQKKNWIAASDKKYKDGDINFLENLFKGVHGKSKQEEFYGKHLASLFFEALNLAKRPNDGYALPDNRKVCIPFLNGGLFEEEQEPQGHRNIIFPTYLFEELFKFFNSYNFTIYENSPQDHTMAVDPEMLGHIFENLLEDNKDKGAFYTPKEIVQYMTQESLIQYLSTSLPKLYQNNIESLIRNNDVSNLKDSLTDIDQAIDKVKICDPAIGSGAFPMGLLQEIFNIKSLIHYHLGYEIWSPATVKQNIIQNSIYGVDIEIGAVDISRLRFWLSLVVDEDLPKPLPNLDYKIVCGNSMVGFRHDIVRNAKLEEEIELCKKDFFKESVSAEKKRLRSLINEKLQKLFYEMEPYVGYKVDFDFKLFFSEVWKENGGFDIVIGNPPYVDIKNMDNAYAKILFSLYETAENRINLYSLFLERGWDLLNKKGTLCYINPNSLLVNSSYKKIRALLVDNLIKLVKLPDKVFVKAIVETMIILANKSLNNDIVLGAYYKNDDNIDFDKLEFKTFDINQWKEDKDLRYNIFTSSELYRIISYIDLKNTNHIIDYFDFSLGITPYDKAKGHTPETIKLRKYHSKKKEDDSYVPLISGSNILKYNISDKVAEFLSYGEWLGAPRKRKFFVSPRVIVRQIISGNPPSIYAGYTEKELYQTQIGFSIIQNKDGKYSPKYLCAILNSSLISFYHKYKYTDPEKNVFQKILIQNCKELPVADVCVKSHNSIIKLVDFILYLKDEEEKINEYTTNDALALMFEEVINAMVYELYFERHLKKLNLNVIQLVEQSLERVSNLAQDEQINHLFKEWNEYDSELRNRIILQRTRSEYIATIEKALEI